MAEYIERKAAKLRIFEYGVRHRNNSSISSACENLERQMNSIPAADVRPVVLCKDCVHFQQFRPHDGFCKIDGMLWNNDFFCANGKREES